MKKKVVVSFTLLIVLSVLGLTQSRETGAIVGRVMDEQKGTLPGVTVTLSGKALMGERTTLTDANGAFRFPALPPGKYSVSAALSGFKTITQEEIGVTTTVTLAVDLTLLQATLSEQVTVQAKAPTVDVKSSETASVTMSNEILRNIPNNQFTSDIVNLAPGVVNNVAYGASQNTGIAYTVDGVNVADPEAGSAWVFMDYNIVEEAKVMGVGLPAEYGNFTGVIFNLITKTGGNTLSGHFEFDYQGKKSDAPKGLWQTENNGAYVEDFPDLSSPLLKLLDGNAHLGGPIIKDKLWFYVGAQYYETWTYPTGFPEALDYYQPRLFVKLTGQASDTLTLMGSMQIDTYNGTNREGSATVSPEATVNQKSPEIVGNFSLTKILSPKTFLELKTAYFWGYYYLDPKVGTAPNAHYELSDNNFRTQSAGTFFYADRTRFQANASLTHYAEDFIQGNHDFKFGVEFERSAVRNRFGYTGKDHMVYWDNYGANYLAYQYEGYDTQTNYTRIEGFAQDSWQISDRLNVNFGLRLSQNWGDVKNVDGTVFKTSRLAPRIGLTYDLLGDKSTILKAHYGQFTEAMLSSFHSRLNPASAYKDYVSYFWDGEWVEYDRTSHENLYKLADKIKHPYMNQITFGVERELFRDASLGVTFIRRDWKNLIGSYNTLGAYIPVPVTVEETGKTYTVYERTSSSSDKAYILNNIRKGDPGILENPYRNYTGLELLFNKRFSNRWQILASYLYSRTYGTMDNGFGNDIGQSTRDSLTTADPNFWINAEGHSSNDPTHQIKIQGTYVIPGVEVAVNVGFQALSGNTWTTRYTTERLAQGRVTFFIEPRGSHHYDMTKILDMRFEKIFSFSGRYRLGLILDVFNVFNSSTITSWGTGYGSGATYFAPSVYPSTDGHNLNAIVRPRQARLGIRLIF